MTLYTSCSLNAGIIITNVWNYLKCLHNHSTCEVPHSHACYLSSPHSNIPSQAHLSWACNNLPDIGMDGVSNLQESDTFVLDATTRLAESVLCEKLHLQYISSFSHISIKNIIRYTKGR